MRVLLLLGLVACGHHGPLYSGPPNLSDALDPLPTDSFYSQYVAIFDGGRKPHAVENLTARCEDEALCTTMIVPASEHASWPELRVIPKAPGKTVVIVELTHPTTKQHEQHRMSVEIIAAAQHPPLALGTGIAPHVQPLLHTMKRAEGDAPVGHCFEDHSNLLDHINGSERSDVKVFSCQAINSELQRLRKCNGMCPSSGVDEHYTLCAKLDAGLVSSATIMDYEASVLKIKEVDGIAPADLCKPKA